MSTTTSHQVSPTDVLRLHTVKRSLTVLAPINVVVIALLIAVLTAGIFYQFGSRPRTDEWIEGMKQYPGVAYGMAGFLTYYGVQSVASSFPLALAFGATRRAFALGTFLAHAILAAGATLLMAIVLLLELATNQWFVGLYLANSYALGNGDVVALVVTIFLGSLTALAVGSLFGAAFSRMGRRGPIVVAVSLVVILGVGLLILAPRAADIAASFENWWLAIAAIAVATVAYVAQYLLLRRASVR